MLDLGSGGAKIAAVEDPLPSHIWAIAEAFLKQKQRASRAVIGRNHGNLHTPGVWYLGGLFKVKSHKPSRVDPKLLPDKICCWSTAVYWTMTPRLPKPDVMVTVKVAEEVCIASFYSPVAKGIHADRKARYDFVERAGSLIGLFPA